MGVDCIQPKSSEFPETKVLSLGFDQVMRRSLISHVVEVEQKASQNIADLSVELLSVTDLTGT